MLGDIFVSVVVLVDRMNVFLEPGDPTRMPMVLAGMVVGIVVNSILLLLRVILVAGIFVVFVVSDTRHSFLRLVYVCSLRVFNMIV